MASSKEFYVPLRQNPNLQFSGTSTIDEDLDDLPKTRRLGLSTLLLSTLLGILLTIIVTQAVFMMRLRASAQSKLLSPSKLPIGPAI